MRIIILLLIVFLPFANGFSQKERNFKKLTNDFDYAVQELKLQHQGLYNYLDQDETDSAISNLRGQIDGSTTKLEFYTIIRQLLGLMNEGHGSVDLPKWTMIKTGLTKTFLPIGLKYLDGDLIIAQNFGENIEGLTKGATLVGINDESISEILSKLLPLIPTDGFNKTSQLEWIDNIILSLLYRIVYGEIKMYDLEIIEPIRKERKQVTIPAIRFTQFKSKNAKFKGRRFNYTDFNFEQLNDSIAYLSIPSFSSGVVDYEAFYEEQFKKIYSLNIKHLIIDIQANTGGTEGNENLLFSYLSTERIRKYKKVTMLPKPYHKNKNNRGYKFDKWELKGSIAERGEFTLYSDYYSELGYTPPNKEYIYQNKLYVLTSGATFSGGAEFASLVKMTNRAIFIGEETGGTYEGNVSGYTETIKLPHTNIKVNIPTVHFQIDVEPEIKGRGIIPDHIVPQTLEDYLDSKNSKLVFAKKLIMN